MVSIHQRPPEVDDRVIPDHWEGDLIKGRGNASAVGTLVERTSLFVTLAKVADGGAQAAVESFSTVLNRIDVQRRLLMTYDQGKEMSQHEKLSERTGVKVYFADPHSPWQRGINENTDGQLVFGEGELGSVAWALNTRPRKASDSNALLNSFYLIHLMPTNITAGLLNFTLETARLTKMLG